MCTWQKTDHFQAAFCVGAVETGLAMDDHNLKRTYALFGAPDMT